MTTIVAVSPHPDDAVLSYGGRLAEFSRRGDRVVVYTVFAGSPLPPFSPAAVERHREWEVLGDPMGPRLAEDRSALALLGLTPIYGTFLDAIYRRDANGAWLVPPKSHPQGDSAPDEPSLVTEVATAVEGVIRDNGADQVITCSALGDHVDHVRTRDATVSAVARTSIQLLLWEDLPYAAWSGFVPVLPAGASMSDGVAEPVSRGAWEAKLRAVACYASQHRMLANGGSSIIEQLDSRGRAHAERVGGMHRGELVRPVTLATVDRGI